MAKGTRNPQQPIVWETVVIIDLLVLFYIVVGRKNMT